MQKYSLCLVYSAAFFRDDERSSCPTIRREFTASTVFTGSQHDTIVRSEESIFSSSGIKTYVWRRPGETSSTFNDPSQ